MSDLRARLDEVMKLRGWNMSEWSEAAGLSRGYVQLIHSGTRGGGTRIDKIKALARVAGVRWEWLFDGSGPRDAPSRTVHGELPPGLAELLSHPPEEGRKGVWDDDTVALCLQFYGLKGVDMTPEQWRVYGDKMERLSKSTLAELKVVPLRKVEPLAERIEAEQEAEKARMKAALEKKRRQVPAKKSSGSSTS